MPSTHTSQQDNHTYLLELAKLYKGLSRKQLADALGRDATKLLPANGNPKLDYLVRLADLLDWPVGDVARAIWDDAPEAPPAYAPPGAAFEELNLEARRAHVEGRYADMIEVAKRMRSAAASAHERALAAHRESAGWDGLGRYACQLEAVRMGLRETPIPDDLRLLLRANLANSYLTLWHLVEARAIARDLIDEISVVIEPTRSARAAMAFSHFVLGNACLRLSVGAEAARVSLARSARESLAASKEQYTAMADQYQHEPWRGIANTCVAGLLEAEVEIGSRDAEAAVAMLVSGLDGVVDLTDTLVGDRLESYGWWCVTGGSISLRHLHGGDLQRAMAIFTNKGYEIADKLNNWAMRERLFSMEFLQREQLTSLAGFPVDWTIDSEEARLIIGTMGRFPSFRDTGWKILKTATVLTHN